MAKFKIEDHIPNYEEDQLCERCEKPGAADYGTETLCKDCTAEDVFEAYNERED